MNGMSELHSLEDLEYIDSNGKPVMKNLTYVSDLQGFLQAIVAGRGISDPYIVISADSGWQPDIINN